MSAGARSKLLVVDDDPDVAYSFTRVFRPPEFEIVEARSGEQAMNVLKSARPDVVLMDVRMPGGSGLATLTKMRRSGSNVPVVLMTAYGSLRIASEAVQAGAFDCIMKPFDVSRIRQVVASALEASRLGRQAAAGKPVTRAAPFDEPADSRGRSATSTLEATLGETLSGSQLAGDGVFDLLFEEIARRQPLEEGLDAFDVVERHLIQRALQSCKGNQSKAAKFLGITRNTLRKRIKKYGFTRDSDDDN
ncbi:MAG: response regulator [Candidatus Sumerlaeaceae bacterium]